MKKLYYVLSFLIIAAFVLAACAPTDTEAPSVVEPTDVPIPAYIACQVSDTGGTDDKSFNQFAWLGMTNAEDEFGVDVRFLESTGDADYEPSFVGIDHWSQDLSNYLGTFYNIYEGTMLLGYLAAGMTETGIVGVYAGINIPPVTAFSDGLYLGIQAYNEAHGTDVKLEGWDPVAQDGLFTGDFFDTDKGRTMTEVLLDAGADIIMPVAGPVGAGSLAVFEERDAGLLIGVDSDWSAFYPDQAQYVLASAMKRMDLVVYDAIVAGMDGTFEGGNYTGNLENGRVGMAVGSAWLDQIPADLMAEIEALADDIIAGEVSAVFPRDE